MGKMNKAPPTIVFAGGGTGGHLFPAIAVATQLRRRRPDVNIIFIGTARGIEVRVVPQYGFALELLPVLPLRGRGFRGLVRGLWAVPKACYQAALLLRRHRISFAVGVGGYAAGPALMMATCLRIPTAIMEQNAHAGLTNRLLAPWCRNIVLAMPNKQLGSGRKVQLLGNPVRPQLVQVGRTARHYPDAFGAARPLHLLVMGGSQGARAINEAVCALLPLLVQANLPVHVHHQTGSDAHAAVQAQYLAYPSITATVVPFIDDMAQAYGTADLAICRSGASTLAELAVVGLPAVLVPYPSAADDHQTHNAQVMVQQGGAVLIPQSQLQPYALLQLLQSLAAEPARLCEMAKMASHLAKPDAVEAICQLIEAEVYDV